MALNVPSSAPNAIPPGWYADPSGPGHARWWSGQDWTHHVQALPTIAPQAPADEPWTALNLLVPRQKTLATRSLGWGIVSILINPLFLSSVFAIVYGALGVRHARDLLRQGNPPVGSARAIAGLVLGAIGVGIAVIWIAIWFSAVAARS